MSRVLVVDDDPQLTRALRITLHAAGYDVLTAPDGDLGDFQLREGKRQRVLDRAPGRIEFEIDARVFDGRVALDYYPTRKFGFGLGYNYIDTEIVETDDPVLRLDYTIDGVQAYLNFGFD